MTVISTIFSTLVPPRSSNEPIEIRGATIPLAGKLYTMLEAIYAKADSECRTPIRFVTAPDGTQNNEVRSSFIALVESPSLDQAKKLGERLCGVTTDRSGLGLLFFVLGKDGNEHKLMVSRFPANQGIIAEPHGQELTVEFVEKVFMKNERTYKAAVYRSASPVVEFWDGHVVDKQIETHTNYWIKEFLNSDFRTTSRAGSRRLAVAMRRATNEASNVAEKHQLVSAMTLVAGLKDEAISPRGVLERFALPSSLQQAVIRKLPNDESADATFFLDTAEFIQVAAYRTVKLDSGGMLTASTEEFDSAFEKIVLDEESALVRFTAEGHVVDETVKGR